MKIFEKLKRSMGFCYFWEINKRERYMISKKPFLVEQ